MESIGFIGLGHMGSKLVERLINAGYTVIGHNRTKAKAEPLIKRGMRWAGTPREVVNSCNISLMSLTDDEAVSTIIDGKDGIFSAISSGKMLIDMSTISPKLSRNIAKRISEKHAHMLDAPISGNPLMVEKGQATIMVGGDHSEFMRAQPILESISSKVFYIGENGQALVLKLAINISIGVQLYALSEGMLLVQKSGIDMNKAVDVILQSAIASPNIQQRAPCLLNPSEQTLFSIKLLQKDILLALEEGRHLGVPLLNTAITNEALTAACSQNYADADIAVMFKSIKQMLERK